MVSRPPIRALALIVVVLLVAGVYAAIDRGSEGYYTFAPGSAPTLTSSAGCRSRSPGADPSLATGQPCARLEVPTGKAHAVAGSLYMVDVLVGPTTPGDYLLDKLGLLGTFSAGSQLIPKGAVLGTTPAAQLACQDAQEMAGATSTATVVALRRLGYDVKENDLGAQLDEVAAATPAARAGLQCNDLVTSVDGKAVRTATDLVNAVHGARVGATVPITVERVVGGATKTVTLRATLVSTPALNGQPAEPDVPFLGVVPQSRITYTFPFHVTIDVGTIGGPSAGLALTLGLLDVLSNGQLTGGHRVAATGTINLDGTVGDVGGVAQKAVAVRRAGATVFLVPPQELAAAQSTAGSMKVYPVATLQAALADLQKLGGHIPPTTARPTAAG